MTNLPDPETARLVEELASPDPGARAAAAEALCHAGEAARPAAAALVAACADGDETVREWIVAALEELGPPVETDLGALVPLVGSPEPLVAYWAATLVGRQGSAAAPAVDALVARLEGAGPIDVRQRAAWALGQIGAPAAKARPALEAAAGGDDPRLARLASEALAALGS